MTYMTPVGRRWREWTCRIVNKGSERVCFDHEWGRQPRVKLDFIHLIRYIQFIITTASYRHLGLTHNSHIAPACCSHRTSTWHPPLSTPETQFRICDPLKAFATDVLRSLDSPRRGSLSTWNGMKRMRKVWWITVGTSSR
jgi:hypothetical protein